MWRGPQERTGSVDHGLLVLTLWQQRLVLPAGGPLRSAEGRLLLLSDGDAARGDRRGGFCGGGVGVGGDRRGGIFEC